jgi:hypothetical protein
MIYNSTTAQLHSEMRPTLARGRKQMRKKDHNEPLMRAQK